LNPEKTRTEYSKAIASLTPGFSGADIANVVNEAAIIAARENLSSVGMKQFEMATERVIGGIEKKSVMTKEERRRVAYHEAGHAVAGWFLEHSDPLLKITIIPRSKGALGFAQYLPSELSLYSKEQLLDMIKTALGGRVAEEIFYDTVTTGASDDINKVTQIANGLVQTYGMTKNIGLVGYGSMGDNEFQKPYSDETNWEIDEEVRNIVREQYQLTKDLLTKHQDKMRALGDSLLEKETINLPQIIDILGERPYGMNETAEKYLMEMRKRDGDEQAEAAKKANEGEEAEDKENEGGKSDDEADGDKDELSEQKDSTENKGTKNER
jgi:AFG3 family protein